MAVIYNLAGLYNSMGEIEKSKVLFLKILKHNSKFTEADRIISETTKYEKNNQHFQEMKKKLKDEKLNEESLVHLYFALAKAYHDQKDFDAAFKNYKKANDLCKKIRKYKIDKDKEIFSSIKKNFINLDISSLKNIERKFIFIIGMPRSGTSLTEQILSSHNNVFGGGELPITERIYNNYFDNKLINNETLVKSNKEYLEYISNIDNTGKVFTDKAPLNFLYVGFILKYLPNSKLYKDIIVFWKKYFPKKIYDLNYESLVTNSEKEIKNLLKFCELEWDENCLNPEKNTRVIKTISYNQARQPIYKTSLKSYSNYDNYLKDLKILI